jgi:hypothetical protein
MKEHIEYIEKQIVIHEDELSRLRNALTVLKGLSSESTKGTDLNKKQLESGKTLREIIMETLEEGIPKTKSDFLEAVRRYKGADYKSASLSPHVSSMVGKLIEKEVFHNNPIATKYYYGKIDWFNGDQLKSEYKNKIQNKIKSS